LVAVISNVHSQAKDIMASETVTSEVLIEHRHTWSMPFKTAVTSLGVEWINASIDRPTGFSRALVLKQPSAANNRVLMFWHGLGNDLLFPQCGLFLHLLQNGWSIVSVDLDGHGQAASSRFQSDSIFSLPVDTIRYTRELFPADASFYAAGYSIGAVLLLNACTHADLGLEHIFLIGMPWCFPSGIDFVSEGFASMDPRFWHSIPQYGLFGAIPAIGRFRRRSFPVRLPDVHSANRNYLDIAQDIISNTPTKQNISKLRQPATLVRGSFDRIALAPWERGSEQNDNKFVLYERIPTATHHTCLLSPTLWNCLSSIKEPTISKIAS
jgi:pimeloyl-ACP methyl ester carboxylesterase